MDGYIIEEYKNFGKCVRFEKKGVVLMVTLDIGPRIIYFGTEKLNFLKEDISRAVSKNGEYFDENYKQGETWYLYGGHRVWKSPEDLETYTPDNYPVEYKLTENGGTFTTKAGRNFDFTLKIELGNDGKAEITDKITNKSNKEREIAVWGLTVMDKNGLAVVPKNKKVNDLLPIQNIVTWPYNELLDMRINNSYNYFCVHQTNNPRPLKVGTFNKRGRAYYLLSGKAMEMDFNVVEEGSFVDFGCNMEIYTNNSILELEILSPIKKLKSGESAELNMSWSVKNNIEIEKLNDDVLIECGII